MQQHSFFLERSFSSHPSIHQSELVILLNGVDKSVSDFGDFWVVILLVRIPDLGSQDPLHRCHGIEAGEDSLVRTYGNCHHLKLTMSY